MSYDFPFLNDVLCDVVIEALSLFSVDFAMGGIHVGHSKHRAFQVEADVHVSAVDLFIYNSSGFKGLMVENCYSMWFPPDHLWLPGIRFGRLLFKDSGFNSPVCVLR